MKSTYITSAGKLAKIFQVSTQTKLLLEVIDDLLHITFQNTAKSPGIHIELQKNIDLTSKKVFMA